MAKTLQFRRGTTAELSSVTGAVGEIFIDTTKDTVVVMDGSTAGGHPLAKEGAGGGGSTGDFTFSANTITLPLDTTGVINTSGLQMTPFIVTDWWQYAYLRGAENGYNPFNLATDYFMLTDTGVFLGYSAQVADIIQTFSELTIGSQMILVDNFGTYTRTVASFIQANEITNEFAGIIDLIIVFEEASNMGDGGTTLLSVSAEIVVEHNFTLGSDGAFETGDFTFSANTVTLSTDKNAVFQTNGFVTERIVTEPILGGNFGPFGYYSTSQTKDRLGIAMSSNAVLPTHQDNFDRFNLARELVGSIAPGTQMILVTDELGTFTRTFDSVTDEVGFGGELQFTIFFTEETNPNQFGTLRQVSFEVPASGTFTMDTDGTFLTDTLLAGDVYVANNIITPLPGGNYGATAQPLVINGDLTVLGHVSQEEWTIFSGISPAPPFEGTNYTITERNMKYVFLPTELGGDAYIVYITLPSENTIGDTVDFIVSSGKAGSLSVVIQPGTTNGISDVVITQLNPSTPVSVMSDTGNNILGSTVKMIYIGNNKWIHTKVDHVQ